MELEYVAGHLHHISRDQARQAKKSCVFNFKCSVSINTLCHIICCMFLYVLSWMLGFLLTVTAAMLMERKSCNVNQNWGRYSENWANSILTMLLHSLAYFLQLDYQISNFKYQIFQRFQIPNFVFSCIWQHDRRKECTNNCRKFIGRTFVA